MSPDASPSAPRPRPRARHPLAIALAVMLPVVAVLANLGLGAASLEPSAVAQALIQPDGSLGALIVQTVRLPRAILAAILGAALAIAGAITQGMVRNPLAAPDLLGIHGGAALAMVLAMVLGVGGDRVEVALAGAAIAGATIYGLAATGPGGASPLKLIIAGAALSALLGALTAGILILDDRSLDDVRFWLVGSLAGQGWSALGRVLFPLLLGFGGAIALGRPLTLLALGDDVAQGMGLPLGWVKAFAAATVVLLAGSAVAVAGPIGFLGLVVPHGVRAVVGVDYRWILPYAASGGATLLSVADLLARWGLRPLELPAGTMTALLGAPFFIYLIRRSARRSAPRSPSLSSSTAPP
ncbi:MAG: iron ABC transporter permease [Cyanobacteria bacterium]|nr:iron ABC transporter permease [Cyanobacteriota bacterium]